MIPPSPEAAAFAKAANYDVGPFTGRPDIHVPIYTIKTRSLTVPISLSYDETGIRVDNIATWVGMNWSLETGGVITRSVMDRPDEGINGIGGYLNAPPPRQSAITNTPTYVDYFIDKLVGPFDGNSYDLKPDRFYYSINGKEGSFQFKPDLSIMQIPQTSLKITMQHVTGNQISFQIVDETGTTYVFTTLESSQVYTTNGAGNTATTLNLTTAWYLSKIISNDGNDTISYNYETEWSGTQKSSDFQESYLTILNNSQGQAPNHRKFWSGMEMTTNSQRIKSIVFTGGKVEFNRVGSRLDDIGSRLDNIVIYSSPDNSNYTVLRSFSFKQGYYYSTLPYSTIIPSFTPSTRDTYRLRLDTLVLKDAGGNAVSNYQFYYNSNIPPPKTSCSQDWWGYFNGKGNQTLIQSQPFTCPYASFIAGGADRTSDETSMKAGILEKIVYPTGGYTVFETEAHRFLPAGSPSQSPAYAVTAVGVEGQVHKEVIDFTAPPLIDFATTLNINFSPYNISGNPTYINADDQAGHTAYSIPTISIKDLDAGTTTLITSSDPTNWTTPAGLTYNFVSNKRYEVSAFCYVNQAGVQATLTFSCPVITTPLSDVVGGLRIKSIKDYNIDNSLAGQETYAYGQTENGLGEYTSIPNFSNSMFLSETGAVPSSAQEAMGGPTNTESVTMWYSGLIFDQTLLQGSPVAYRYVTKYHGDPNNNTGKTVYYYGSDPFYTTAPLPTGMGTLNNMGILVTCNPWANGQLVSQQEYRRGSDGSYTLVQQTTNTYNKPVTDADYALLAKVVLWLLYPSSGYQLNNFIYDEIPTQTGFVQLTQSEKDEYLTGQTAPVATITNYTYDTNHPDFQTGESYTDSKGELIQTTKKYPFNKTDLLATGTLTTAQQTAIDNMVTKNIISPVMEETSTVAGTQTSRKRTPYELVNGSTIAPVNTELQVGSNPIETRVLYTQYDALGNLLAQQKANDVNNAYVWDYQSSKVVAAVNNALPADVAYTSFEADGTGGWNLGSTSRDATSGVTGGRSYILTNLTNDIQRTGLTAATTYVVSYWTTNSTAFTIAGTISGYPVKGKTVTINGTSWTYFEHKVTGQTTISITGAGHIDELRLYPANAQMQSFTYNPMIGMTSLDDVAGTISYYEYDAFDRLQDIRDQDGNIIKTFEYHYQQP